MRFTRLPCIVIIFLALSRSIVFPQSWNDSIVPVDATLPDHQLGNFTLSTKQVTVKSSKRFLAYVCGGKTTKQNIQRFRNNLSNIIKVTNSIVGKFSTPNIQLAMEDDYKGTLLYSFRSAIPPWMCAITLWHPNGKTAFCIFSPIRFPRFFLAHEIAHAALEKYNPGSIPLPNLIAEGIAGAVALNTSHDSTNSMGDFNDPFYQQFLPSIALASSDGSSTAGIEQEQQTVAAYAFADLNRKNPKVISAFLQSRNPRWSFSECVDTLNKMSSGKWKNKYGIFQKPLVGVYIIPDTWEGVDWGGVRVVVRDANGKIPHTTGTITIRETTISAQFLENSSLYLPEAGLVNKIANTKPLKVTAKINNSVFCAQYTLPTEWRVPNND